MCAATVGVITETNAEAAIEELKAYEVIALCDCIPVNAFDAIAPEPLMR